MKEEFMSIDEALSEDIPAAEQVVEDELTPEDIAAADAEFDELESKMRGINLSAIFPDVTPERLQQFQVDAESGKIGFFETLGDVGVSDVPFIGDVAGAHEMYAQHEAMEAFAEGSMTAEQQELVLQAIEREARGGETFMGKAADLFKGAITFGAEMATVAGTGGAALGLVAGKKAMGRTVKAGIRRKSQRALSDALGDNLARRAAKTLAGTSMLATRAAAVGLGVTGAKELIPRPMYGIGAANATSIRRLFGELNAAESRDVATLLNENIDQLIKDGAPMSWKGLAEVFMINSLEVAGGPAIGAVASRTLGKIPPVAYMNALGVKAIERGLAKLPGKGRTFERIQRFLRDRASFSGELNEVAEELLQNTITEETFGNDWRDGLPEDFEDLAAMFVGFGLLPASGLAVGTSFDGAMKLTERFRAQAKARREQRKLPELPEGLSAELDETQQAPRDVTPEEYKRFVDTGEVDDSTVVAIANAIEQGNADARQEGEFGAGIERDPRILAFMGDSAVSERVEAELARRAAQLKEEPQVEVEITNAARAFGDAVLEQEGAPVTLRSTPEAMPPEDDESDAAEQTRRRSFLGFAAVTLGQRLGRRVFFVDSDAPRRAGAARGAFDANTGTIFIDGTDANPLKTVMHEFFHSGMARVGKAEEGASQEVLDYLKGAFPEAYRSAEALYRSRNLQAEQMAPADLAEEIGATMAEELFDEIAAVLRDPNSEQPFRQLLTRVIEQANESPAARGFFARMLEVLRDMATKLRLAPPRGRDRKLLAELLDTDPATAEEQARLIMDLVGFIEGTTSGSVDVFEDEAGRLRFAPPAEPTDRDVLAEEQQAKFALAGLMDRQAKVPMTISYADQFDQDVSEEDQAEYDAMYEPGGENGVHRYPSVVFIGSNRPFGDVVQTFIGRGEATQWEGYGFYLASHPQAGRFYAGQYVYNAAQQRPNFELPELPVFSARKRPDDPLQIDLELESPESAAPWLRDEESIQAFEPLARLLDELLFLNEPRQISAAGLLNVGLKRIERIRVAAEREALFDEDARDLLDVTWNDLTSLYDRDDTLSLIQTGLEAMSSILPIGMFKRKHAEQLAAVVQAVVEQAGVDGNATILSKRDKSEGVDRNDVVFAALAAVIPTEILMPMALGRSYEGEGFYKGIIDRERRYTDPLAGREGDEDAASLRTDIATVIALSREPDDYPQVVENLSNDAKSVIEDNLARISLQREGSQYATARRTGVLRQPVDYADIVARGLAALTNVAMATKPIREGEVPFETYPAAPVGSGVLYGMEILAPRTSLLQHDLAFDDQPTEQLNRAAKDIVFWMVNNHPGVRVLNPREDAVKRGQLHDAIRNAYELQVQLDEIFDAADQERRAELEVEVNDAWNSVVEIAHEQERKNNLLGVLHALGNRVDRDPSKAYGADNLERAKKQRDWSQKVRAKLMSMGIRGFEYPGYDGDDVGARNFVIFSSADIRRRVMASTPSKIDARTETRRSARVRTGASASLPLFKQLELAATGSGGMNAEAMSLLTDTIDAFVGQTLDGIRHERTAVPVMQMSSELETQTVLESHIVTTDVGVRELVERAHRLGQGLAQEQVHVLEPVVDVDAYEPLHRFRDGSFVTQSVEFTFPVASEEDALNQATTLVGLFGLDNLTINPGADADQLRATPELLNVATTASIYYSGDPLDKKGFEQWQRNVEEAIEYLDSTTGRTIASKEGAYILHNIGTPESGAAIPYDSIATPLPSTTRPNTAQRKRTVAHRAAEFLLNGLDLSGGRNVKAFGGNAGVRWDYAAGKSQQEFDADLFERMAKDDRARPLVSFCYSELQKELVAQWNNLPVQVFGKEGDGQVYENSTAMRRDVQANNRMDIALTMPGAYGPRGYEALQDAPLTQPALDAEGQVITDATGRPLVYNDLLRAVHDYFAHALTDNEFGELGEEGARRTHMAITRNPYALWALMTETYGNNSWVNFWAPNRKKPISERPFAEQKIGLLPIQSLLLRTELPPMPLRRKDRDRVYTNVPLLERIADLAEKDMADANRPEGQRVNAVDVALLRALARPRDEAALEALMLAGGTDMLESVREGKDLVDPLERTGGLAEQLQLDQTGPGSALGIALSMLGIETGPVPGGPVRKGSFWQTAKDGSGGLRRRFDRLSANFKTAAFELAVDQPLVELAAAIRAQYLETVSEFDLATQDPAKGSFADDGVRPMNRVLPRLRFAPYANGRARYDNGSMSDFDPYVMSSAFVDSKILDRAGRGRMDRRYIPSVAGMSENQLRGAAKFFRLTPFGRRFGDLEDAPLLKRIMGVMKKNALFLHDLYPQELRDEARMWYAGGFRLCTEFADEYNLSTPSIAAAMAALSPNKPWMLNLTQGRWAADIYANDRFTTMTDEELAMAYDYASGGKNALRPYVEQAQGKTLHELIVAARGKMPSSPEGELVAMFVKFRSLTRFAPEIRLYTPSGNYAGDVQRNNPLKPGELGVPTRAAFGMMGEITKTMLIFDADGREDHRAIIDKAIGQKNKVRSFYMNLLFPNDLAGDVTNDTHNVAALLLMPLSGKDVYVTQGLSGGKGSDKERVVQEFWAPHGGFDASFGVPNEQGIKGLYGVFADVVRESAMERGVLPREMQSIVWETVRGLFTETQKTIESRRAVTALWDRWAKGTISQPELQRQVMSLFDGVDYPEWAQQNLKIVDVNGTIIPRTGGGAGRAAQASGSASVAGAGGVSGGAGSVDVQPAAQQTAGARRRRPRRGTQDRDLKFAPRTTLRGFGYEREGATAEQLRDARAAFDERRELQTPTANVPGLPLRVGELRLLENVNDEPVRMEPNDEPARTSVLIAPDGTAYLSGKVSDEASDDESVMVPVTWFGGAERGRGDWTASGVAEKAFGARGTVGPRAGKRAAAPATGRSEASRDLRRSYGLSLTPEELARSIAREAIRRGEELPPLADPASTGLVPPQPVEAAAVTASSEQAPTEADEPTLQEEAPERRPQVQEGAGGMAAPVEEEPAGATQAPAAPRGRRGRGRMLERRRQRDEQVRATSVFDDAPIAEPPAPAMEEEEEPTQRMVEPTVGAPKDAGFGTGVPVPSVKVGNANLNNPGNTAETRALWDVVDRDRAVRGGQVIGREEAETQARQLLQDDYDGTRAELERKLSQGVMLEPWENRAMVNIINDLFMQTLNPRLSEDQRREALHDGRELGFAYREMRGNLARSMGSVVGLGMTAKEQVILLMLQLPVIEARRRARIDQELRGYLSQVSAGPLQSQYLQTFFGARRQQGSEYDLRNAPPVNERGQIISERRLQQLVERKRADEELDFERQERARKALEKAGYDALVIEDPDALLDPVHGHIIRNIISSAKATWTDKAIELRQSNLLTGVTTHVVNTTGNAAMMVVNGPVQRLVEGMVADSLRLTMPQKDLDALPMTREIIPFMMGGIRAIPEAVRNFFEAIRTEGPIFEMNLKRAGAQFGAYTQKLDTQDGVKVAGLKGRAARFFSFTMLQAIDEMFKTIAGNMEASALAWRVAWREGLRGDALQRRMDELMADKTSPIWTEALYFGREITLQDTGGEVAQESSRLLNAMGEMLDRMTEWMVLPLGTIAQGLGVKGASRDQNIALPVGLLLFPFRRVPLRLTAQALRRSPMASLSMVKNKVRGNYDGDERLLVRDIADGFIAFGLFMMLLEVLDDEDDELPVITGSRPISRGEAGAEYRTAPPMSVRIGDSYYNYGRIEPLGTSMAVAIDAIDQYRRTGASDALATGTASLVGMLEDKTFLRSIGDLITIMREYRGGNVSEGEAAARFLRNLYVTPWVPNLIRQTARESAVEYQLPRSIVEDGYPAFMTDGMLDSKGEPIATGLTGVAPAIKRDLWGRPIRRGQGEDGFGSDLLMRLLTPMRHMRDVKDISPIDMALVSANERIRRNELVDVDPYFPTLPSRNFTVTVFEDGEEVREQRRMTSPQYDEFIRDAGQAAHAGLLLLLPKAVRDEYQFEFTPDSDARKLQQLAGEVEYAVAKKMDKRDDWSGEFNFESPGAAELAAIKAAKDAAYRMVRKELAERVTGQ